jgi:hypothetical protein
MRRAWGFLILMTFLAASSSAHAFRLKKPWCESALSKEPREIAVLKEDLKAIRESKFRKGWQVSAEISKTSIGALEELFNQSQYREMSPEVRARLISYTLVAWLPIPERQSQTVHEAAQWMIRELTQDPGYSADDLARLRLSWRLFLKRKRGLFSRFGVGEVWEALVVSGFATAGDALITAITTAALSNVLHLVIPGLGFVPIPVFLGFIMVQDFRKTYLEKLEPFARESAQLVESKLLQMIGTRSNMGEIRDRWDRALKNLLRPSGALLSPGILRGLTNDSTQVMAVKNGERREVLNLLIHMARSTERINPVEWREILESFRILKDAAVRMGTPETEGVALMDSMRRVTSTWNGNREARSAAEAFLSSSWGNQDLPPQN